VLIVSSAGAGRAFFAERISACAAALVVA